MTDAESEPLIEHAYSALEEYGLDDMSPQSWQILAERFEEDDELFQTYYTRHTTQNGKADECDEDCKRDFICEIQNLSFPDVTWCKKASFFK